MYEIENDSEQTDVRENGWALTGVSETMGKNKTDVYGYEGEGI